MHVLNKQKISGIALISFFIAIGAFSLYVSNTNQKNILKTNAKQKEDNKKYESYDEQVSKGQIERIGSILELTFKYKKGILGDEVSLVGLKKKNGYVSKKNEDNEDNNNDNGNNNNNNNDENNKDNPKYELTLSTSKNSILYKKTFVIPKTIHDPPPRPGEKNIIGEAIREEGEFTITVPYFDNAIKLGILNLKGLSILSTLLTGLTIENNLPSFKSIKGDDYQNQDNQQSLNWDKLIPKALGQVSTKYLNVVFIGDKYIDMTQFHTDANRFIKNILTYEPFKSRSSQILFHYVDNSVDLGCHHDAKVTRAILCNDATVTQQINTAAVPHDKVVVIVNDSQYGGAADGYLAAGYNGEWGHQVFVHELAHLLGLLDEYNVYSSDGAIDNTVHSNCYAGTPPAPQWQGKVAQQDYSMGCKYPNWYRSSTSNIMIAIDSINFDAVSQELLSHSLDSYTSPTTAPTPFTKISVPSPRPSLPTPTSMIISPSPTNNVNLANSPTPFTKISVPTSSQSYQATCKPSSGDFNCDSSINLVDFEVWRKEFIGSETGLSADANNDGKVDILDYEFLRKSLIENTN